MYGYINMKRYVNFCVILVIFLVLNVIIVRFNSTFIYSDNGLESLKDERVVSTTVDKKFIFCIIKTHPDNIKSNKTLTLLKVWGHKCDNYRFVSAIPDAFLNNAQLETKQKTDDEIEVEKPFYILQPKYHKNETHEKLTDKVYYAFLSIYKRFGDYKWYYLVDDDAYCNLNNMRKFLSGHNSSRAITFGFDFKTIVKGGYHSGGPGYVISGEAYRRLGKKLSTDYKFCQNTGTDDVDVNACLRELGAVIENSLDENGRQRFLCLDITSFYQGSFPDWLKQYSTHSLKTGFDCCADSLIGVHYLSPREIMRLDIAIETQENRLKLYDKYTKLGKKVTFKDIFKNYIALGDFENDQNEYKNIIKDNRR